MKILVTGGCGYTGIILVNKLLNKGHKVSVIDTQWFGKNLPRHKNLKVIKKDIRIVEEKYFKGIYAVVHLANIANDLGVELNPALSWETNVLATNRIVQLAIKQKVKKFIFASSGSVYGIKKEKKVTENLDLVPISLYNKTKMISERVLASYENKIKIYSVRPATVCGFSPRLRLDVSVNMFVYQAYFKKLITVYGGNQTRPNIHIKDLTDLYYHLIIKNVKPGIFNAGFENIKILDLAKMIQKIIPCKIKIKKNINDPRSYRQDSSKLLNSGFRPKRKILDAILELKKNFENKKIKIGPKCFSVKWLSKLGVK